MSDHRRRAESSERSKPTRRGFLTGSASVAGAVVLGGGLASDPALAAKRGYIRPRAAGAVEGPAILGAGEVPAWYEESRVHAHTRLVLGFNQPFIDTPDWEQAPQAFKGMGAKIMLRHLISSWEDPWWPSDAPRGRDRERLFDDDRINANTIFLEAGRDVAVEMVTQAQAAGMLQILYFRHETHKTSEELYPSLVCKDPDGNPLSNNRGIWLDVTGPYGDVVLTQLLELAERGVDAVYFDSGTIPENGSWGSAFQVNYESETGLPAPTVIDREAPEFQPWLDFRAKELVRVIQHWHDEVKALYPDFTFIVSAPWAQALMHRGEPTDLMRIADATKSEHKHALNRRFNFFFFQNNPDFAEPEDDIRQALGYTVMRDTADGRPPHTWGPPWAPNTDHMLAFVASLVTYGQIANTHVVEANILEASNPEGFTRREDNIAAFTLGNLVSPLLSGTKPVRWAAAHYSEEQRNARLADRSKWQDVLWPLTGMFGVLVSEGVPVGTVTDTQLGLGELGGYRLLFLTSRGELTVDQEAAVADFEGSGGAVIENDPAWAWHDPTGTEAAAAAFHSALTSHIPEAPVHVTGGPERLHAVGYGTGGDVSAVAVANDFSFVQLERNPGEINPTPAPASGVQVAWQSAVGGLSEVFEVVSGQLLPTTPTAVGYTVTLPAFRHMALLVTDQGSPVPVENASFEDQSLEPWDLWLPSGEVGAFSRSTDEAASGAASLLCEGVSQGGQNQFLDGGSGLYGIAVSAFVPAGSDPQGILRVAMVQFNGTNQLPREATDRSPDLAVAEAAGQWATFSAVLAVLNELTTRLRFFVIVEGFDIGERIYLDDVRVWKLDS